jgi:uncharacterized protein YraI
MKRNLLTPIFAAITVALSACGTGTPTPTSATLTSPTQQAQFGAGESVQIQGSVLGSAVKKVQIVVNNQPIAEIDQVVEPGKFEIAVPYVLPVDTLGGSTVIELRGVDEQGAEVVGSEPVFIVVRPQATATPEPPPPTAVPTVAPQPTAALTTTTAITSAPPIDAGAAVTSSAPAATTADPAVLNKDNEFVNVRKGPGLTFDIVGQFKQAQTTKVTGKSEDGAWWQVEFTGGENNRGWMFGQLLQFTGDAAKVPAIKVAIPTAAPAAVQPTAAVVAIAPTAPPAPAQPTTPPAALLPYTQNFRFGPRDDIGDVPLGYQGEGNSAKIVYQITGARSAEIEVTTPGTNGLFACPAGNLAGVQPNSLAGKRVPLQLPSGEVPFSISEKGLYLFKIYVVKADGSPTDIPRWVIYDCFKTQ